MCDDAREYVEGYSFTARNRGGGLGTSIMGVSGCVRSGPGTEPRRERASMGAFGAGYALTVQAAWQPAIMAQALKAMPTRPKRTQRMRTIPVTHRHFVRPMGFPPSHMSGRREDFSAIIKSNINAEMNASAIARQAHVRSKPGYNVLDVRAEKS
jgi:hypothetical protein